MGNDGVRQRWEASGGEGGIGTRLIQVKGDHQTVSSGKRDGWGVPR